MCNVSFYICHLVNIPFSVLFPRDSLWFRQGFPAALIETGNQAKWQSDKGNWLNACVTAVQLGWLAAVALAGFLSFSTVIYSSQRDLLLRVKQLFFSRELLSAEPWLAVHLFIYFFPLRGCRFYGYLHICGASPQLWKAWIDWNNQKGATVYFGVLGKLYNLS